jgi:hypothetical protein
MYTQKCTATEKITLEYATDFSTTWLPLNDINGSNVIMTNGKHIFYVGGKDGQQCRFISFRWTMQRGTDASLSPLIEYWLAEFMRLLPATYGFYFNISLNKTVGGKTPTQLLAILKQLADPAITPDMIQFTYLDDLESTVQTHYGKISRLQGDEEAGSNLRGVSDYQVSFMVPYLGDSE